METKLNEAKRKALDESDGNWELGRITFLQMVLKSPTLLKHYQQQLEEYIMEDFDNYARTRRSIERKVPYTGVRNTAAKLPQKGDSGEFAEKSAMVKFGDTLGTTWCNVAKKMLRDCTKEDLAFERDMFMRNAHGNHRQAIFFEQIHDAMGHSKKTVLGRFGNRMEEELRKHATYADTEVKEYWGQ